MNDFYFRLMETTKTEKNKYKIPKRKHSLCDSRNRELAGKWFWRCVSRFALKDAAHRKLLVDFSYTYTKGKTGAVLKSTRLV